jgi:hypothetical protein
MSRTLAQDKPLWRTLLLAGVLAGVSLVAPAGTGAFTYTFTTLDIPGAFFTAAWGINNAGQIVGTGTFPIPGLPFPNATNRGFLYTGGSFSIIDVPSSQFTTAYANRVRTLFTSVRN